MGRLSKAWYGVASARVSQPASQNVVSLAPYARLPLPSLLFPVLGFASLFALCVCLRIVLCVCMCAQPRARPKTRRPASRRSTVTRCVRPVENVHPVL